MVKEELYGRALGQLTEEEYVGEIRRNVMNQIADIRKVAESLNPDGSNVDAGYCELLKKRVDAVKHNLECLLESEAAKCLGRKITYWKGEDGLVSLTVHDPDETHPKEPPKVMYGRCDVV